MEDSEISRKGHVEGKCLKMCPDAEARFRESHNLLSVFEVLNGEEHLRRPRCDPNKCVKEFRRSAAGEKLNNPHHLRPAEVLLQTTNYLLKEIAPREDVPFSSVYDFVFDRLRSVRQDMSIQQISASNAECSAAILEKCLQFYLFVETLLNRRDLKFIDRHIHTDHTQQCFRSLAEIYRTTGQRLASRAEYLSCYLLYNLGSEEVVFDILTSYCGNLKTTHPLDIALEISFAFIHNNFVGIFKRLSRLKGDGKFLVIASVLRNIDRCQSKSIEVLSHSHSSKSLSFPVEDLMKWVYFADNRSIRDVMKRYGMTIDVRGNISFLKANFSISDTRVTGEPLFLKGVDAVTLLL